MKTIESQAVPITGEIDALDEQDSAARTRQALKMFKNVIAVGVAGVGKTHMVSKLAERYGGRIRTTVFHPSTSYEEFVRGLRPTGESFEPRNGLFIDFCNQAIQDPEHEYLLVIDEINRASTAAVLGDLLLVLESSKRFPVQKLKAMGQSWGSCTFTEAEVRDLNENLAAEASSISDGYIYAAQLQTPDADGRDFLVVPDNLHVLGTMNSTDRSVGTIDLALRRRFQWSTISPMSHAELVEELSYRSRQFPTYSVPESLIKWWDNLNDNLRSFVGPDALIGHSYFFSGAEPIEICTAILEQLSEVAQTFMITEEDLEKIQDIDGPVFGVQQNQPVVATVQYIGRGIGRRPNVVFRDVSGTHTGNTELSAANGGG